MDIHLHLFGAPHCKRDGRSVHITRRKGLALLAYLAVNGQASGRETLAMLLYPESPRALAYLRRDLSELKKNLGASALRIDGAVRLDIDAVRVDVLDFLQLVSPGESRSGNGPETRIAALESAGALYTADFLEGFNLPDAPAFDKWQHIQTESLRQALATGLQTLIDYYQTRGEVVKSIANARRWLDLDPLHEPAHRSLMRLNAAAGRRAAALRQYQTCVSLLREELDVSPEAETTALYETLRQPTTATIPLREQPDQRFPSETRRPPSHTGLPVYATPFFGRHVEIDRIRTLLARPDCRLVTLVGPGGIGKTRLALEAAGHLQFEDGVWLVPLAIVETAAAIPAAIADALGLRFYGNEPTDQLLFRQLRNLRLLLILDNFEQLLGNGGGRLVTALLRNVPHLKLLVTSQERLQVLSEHVAIVPGLLYPDATRLSGSIEEILANHSGLNLFVEGARRVNADFTITFTNLVDIVRICRLVEGVPLGLELASSWVAVIPPEEIAAEIMRSLDFLTSAVRDLPDRHRSMKATFDASWKRLNELERRVFGQLSIFRGGFQRQAAESIVQVGVDRSPLLPILSGLVNKSFLRLGEEGRFHIHELLRQHGAGRLAENPAWEEGLSTRYASYFLRFMEEQETRLKGSDQAAALAEIRTEHDNIFAAWEQAVNLDRLELIFSALRSFFVFWAENARFGETAQRVDRVIAAMETRRDQSGRLSDRERLSLARLQVQRGAMGIRTGPFQENLDRLQKGLATHRSLGAKWETALTLNMMSGLVFHMGEYERAAAAARESLELAEVLGDSWLVAHNLIDLGLALKEIGELGAARQCEERALALSRQRGDQRCMAFALCGLGECAFREERYEEAEKHFRECLALREVIGDPWGTAYIFGYLGRLAAVRGKLGAARTYFIETLRSAEQIGARPLYVDALVELAGLEIESGQVESAGRLLKQLVAEPALTGTTQQRAQALLAFLPPVDVSPSDRSRPIDALTADFLANLR